MRLILGFIFFGLLFYAIWLFFPDAFAVLVSWAAKFFNFFEELWNSTFGSSLSPPSHPPAPTPNVLSNQDWLV